MNSLLLIEFQEVVFSLDQFTVLRLMNHAIEVRLPWLGVPLVFL